MPSNYNHDNGSVIVAIDKILAGDGEQIHIQISDTGIGIKMRIRIKDFHRFTRNSTFSTLYWEWYRSAYCERIYLLSHGGEIK